MCSWTQFLRSDTVQLVHPVGVSIDDQIPYLGAYTLRQYICNKPNPVQLKNCITASQDDLVLDYVIYQGSGSFTAAPVV